MNETFDHKLVNSFMLWFDHAVCSAGGFFNVTANLYPSPSRNAGVSYYASPYKQWVGDTSISGAVIPSGVFVSGGGFIPRGSSGLKIDFDGGRVLVNSGVALVAPSGSFSVKEFNVIYTRQAEEKILFDTRYVPNPKVSQTPSGLKEDEIPYPVALIKFKAGQNNPWQFGGFVEETRPEFRAIIVSDSPFKLDAINSVLRDMARTNMALIESSDLPYGFFGDYKSGAYDYDTLIQGKEVVFIEKVFVSDLEIKIGKDISAPICASIVDFQLSVPRNVRR